MRSNSLSSSDIVRNPNFSKSSSDKLPKIKTGEIQLTFRQIDTNKLKKRKRKRKRERIAAYIIKRRIAQHAPRRTTWEDKEGEWNNGGRRVKKAETVVIGEEVEELGFFDKEDGSVKRYIQFWSLRPFIELGFLICLYSFWSSFFIQLKFWSFWII